MFQQSFLLKLLLNYVFKFYHNGQLVLGYVFQIGLFIYSKEILDPPGQVCSELSMCSSYLFSKQNTISL